jgi:hypothetical protein
MVRPSGRQPLSDRLALPLQGCFLLPLICIGANFGYFLLRLTNGGDAIQQLLLSIVCFVLLARCISSTVDALYY